MCNAWNHSWDCTCGWGGDTNHYRSYRSHDDFISFQLRKERERKEKDTRPVLTFEPCKCELCTPLDFDIGWENDDYMDH